MIFYYEPNIISTKVCNLIFIFQIKMNELKICIIYLYMPIRPSLSNYFKFIKSLIMKMGPIMPLIFSKIQRQSA